MRNTHAPLHPMSVVSYVCVALIALTACSDPVTLATGSSGAGAMSSAANNNNPWTPPITILVSPASKELEAGDTVQLEAVAMNRPGHMVHGHLRWSSQDTNVAVVSENGLVTATGPGTTMIDASMGVFSGSSTITVRPMDFAFGVSVTTLTNGGIYGIDGVSANEVWFGCGFRCAMRFDGTQWVRLSIGFGGNLYGANARGGGNAFFGAQVGVGTGHVVRWNGGFIQQTSVQSELFGVWTDSPTSGFACGDAKFYRFQQGQATIQIPTGLNQTFNGPDRFDQAWGTSATNVFCAGRSGLYRYNGTTFTRVATGTLSDVSGTSASNVWAVGRLGVVHHFDGTNWTSVDAGQGAIDVRGLAVLDNGWVVLATLDNRLLVYNGRVWRSQTLPAGYTIAPAGLYAPNNRTLFIAGSRNSDNKVVVIRAVR
ncbi:MAG TPA: Ig-like domain-containing protein [Gemmatimonadaceae bacterium]|nr:Ig-like domain-containing protein [Gemmatimonadaceae bacterium]